MKSVGSACSERRAGCCGAGGPGEAGLGRGNRVTRWLPELASSRILEVTPTEPGEIQSCTPTLSIFICLPLSLSLSPSRMAHGPERPRATRATLRSGERWHRRAATTSQRAARKDRIAHICCTSLAEGYVFMCPACLASGIKRRLSVRGWGACGRTHERIVSAACARRRYGTECRSVRLGSQLRGCVQRAGSAAAWVAYTLPQGCFGSQAGTSLWHTSGHGGPNLPRLDQFRPNVAS